MIKFKRLTNDALLPVYKTDGASGMDVTTIDNYNLAPGEIKIFQTGLACAVSKGFELQVRSRSGLSSKHGIAVVNGVGTVDSDYRGQIGVPLINLSKNYFHIQKGDRIAQLVVCPVKQVKIVEVDDLDETTRGDGGFGSTGV